MFQGRSKSLFQVLGSRVEDTTEHFPEIKFIGRVDDSSLQ